MPITNNDWPQIGRDPQRTNYSPLQVNGPYAYAGKWFEVPMPNRAQPVVLNDKLFMPSMNGKLYCRNALNLAAIWELQTDGALRASAAAVDGRVFVHSSDGYVYAITIATGALDWSRLVGPSATSPLVDEANGRLWVTTTTGKLVCLGFDNTFLYQTLFQGAIMTSPSLSVDGATVYLGTEELMAYAINAANGLRKWQTKLPGQSMGDRYPVIAGSTVMFRTQPLDHFHRLLQDAGDTVLNQAGAVNPDWAADWAAVKPYVLTHLTNNPHQQTLHVLNTANGRPVGVAPVLYAYGSNAIPQTPAVRANGDVFITYRARHGIQTDGGAVHVTTQFDAEIGKLNLTTLDVVAQTASNAYARQWRATSDEAHAITFSSDLLLMDSWERSGGINLSDNAQFPLANVATASSISNDPWVGPGANPFFPLSGAGNNGRPFPLEIEGESHIQPGIVVASGRLFWRVAGGGIACLAPTGQAGTTQVFTVGSIPGPTHVGNGNSARAMSEYVSLDLTTPVVTPDAALVARLNKEVADMVRLPGHVVPYFYERGFRGQEVWPAGSPTQASELPHISYNTKGNVLWHDVGELMQTVAMAYPYLTAALKIKAKAWMEAEIARYAPIEDLPQYNAQRDWLRTGFAREPYAVPFRNQLNNFPSVNVSLNVFYGIWLWCKNTNDWSYANNNQSALRALYTAKLGNIRYYADIAGLIGYARIAAARGWTDAASSAATATNALTNSTGFSTFDTRANADFEDPTNLDGDTDKLEPTGEQLPAFWGLVPEIGLYLSEKTSGAAKNRVIDVHHISVMPLWWSTKQGHRATRSSETSCHAPFTAWSGFLARAYMGMNTQAELKRWLDFPWCVGDLYSIQKIVAAIHTP